MNFKDIREAIGQALFNYYENDKETHGEVANFFDTACEGYVLVEWPESQDYMEEEWFEEEAILDFNGSSAYFIPISRIFEKQ